MTFKLILLATYVLAIGFFVTWFVTANGLGRDNSPEGQLTDQHRRRRMRALMSCGFVALALALGLPFFR